MKRVLTLLPALALLQISSVLAQPNNEKSTEWSPASKKAAPETRAFSGRAFADYNPGVNKTTANERISTMSFYGTSGLQDSIRFIYSNGLGSKYDFLRMDYGTITRNPLAPTRGYVNFDTLYSSKGQNKVLSILQRNAAGQISKHFDKANSQVVAFSYNTSGQMTAQITMSQSTSGVFDTLGGQFYTYNTAGKVATEITDNWNKSTKSWVHDLKIVVTYDASGRVTSEEYQQYISGTYQKYYQIQSTYAGASLLPMRSLATSLTGSNMEPYILDSFNYNNGNLIYHSSYDWNITTGKWVIYSKEYRRLNAASLPDSIGHIEWNGGNSAAYCMKYKYNSQNNPVSELEYDNGHTAPDYKTYYTYKPISATAVQSIATQRLEFYPNPASEKLHLKGVTGGNYLIYNTSGQLVQSGTLQNNAEVPVQFLARGMYILNVKDSKGENMQANFIRQ